MGNLGEKILRMTDATTQAPLQRQPRYRLSDGQVTSVTVRRRADRRSNALPADVLELWQGGAKLSVESRVAIGDTVQVKFDFPDRSLQLTASAEVCWTRPALEPKWVFGSSFSPELPLDCLSKLAAEGYLEKQDEVRYDTALRARVLWVSGETESPCTVRNFSAGGFCLSTGRLALAGDRLVLHVDRPEGSAVTIPAKVQWSHQEGDTHLVGCAFFDSRGYRCLGDVISLLDVV